MTDSAADSAAGSAADRRDTKRLMDDDEMLAEWAEAACAELGIDWEDAAGVVLGLASQVAGVSGEQEGTISAYLLGVAVGHGHPVAGAAVRLREFADDWQRSGGR
jgi:hypothetical protein